jgi:hypothetical protein
MDSFVEIKASVLAPKVRGSLFAHESNSRLDRGDELVRLRKLNHLLSLVGPEATVHLSATDAQTLRYREL